MNEAEAIALMRALTPGREHPMGSGDDAAVLPQPDHRRVLTTDALVEGTHFIRAHPPRWLGAKLLNVNLSDVAAMGAKPEAFVLSAALPRDTPERWWRALATGLGDTARAHDVALVGGDVVRSSGPVMFSVSAWGVLTTDDVLTRDGGEVGDMLMVIGQVGASARGLATWLDRRHEAGWPVEALPEDLDEAVAIHLNPQPPLSAGPLALAQGARAGLDLSDGLATDIPRLAAASGLAIHVDLDALPPNPACPDMSPVARALGGEDYGLAVLVPPSRVDALQAIGFYPLGHTQAGEGVVFYREGKAITLDGPRFTHL